MTNLLQNTEIHCSYNSKHLMCFTEYKKKFSFLNLFLEFFLIDSIALK